MNKSRLLGACLSTLGMIASVDASLIGRLPTTSGGTDYQAYYDDALNITWQTNAGRSGETWTEAKNWIASMNTSNYLGVNAWRLPRTLPVNGSSFNVSNSYDGSTDSGYNISSHDSVYPFSTASEMAHMFHVTLANTGRFDVGGNETGCISEPGECLGNTGPFEGLNNFQYWSETEDGTSFAWYFDFGSGAQARNNKVTSSFAWAVTDGDPFSPVPIPAAFWLFGSGLLGLVGIARRKKAAFSLK